MNRLENQAVVWIRKAAEIHHGFLSRKAADQRRVMYVLNLDGLGLEVGDTIRSDSNRTEL